MMNVIMRKKIDFGNVDFFGCGVDTNACDVVIELRKCGGNDVFKIINGKKEYTGEKTPEYTELSICGNIWNKKHSDIVSGGQNLDDMLEFLRENEKFVKIHNVWKNWHMNGMHAGTPEQEDKVREWLDDGNKYDYTDVCEMLKRCNLYEVEFTGKTVGRMYDHENYRYGTGWIVKDLPDDVIEFVKEV